MVRTLDRYVIREVIPPFLLSLLILTFLLVLPPVMEHLEKLLAKGVSWTTAARIIWTAVPQAAGLTIPMSLLVGSAGRARAGCRPTGRRSRSWPAASARTGCSGRSACWARPRAAATLYVMLVSIPDANQTFRELTFEVISKRIESDIHPRVFFQDFPGWVLYARDEPDPGDSRAGRICWSPRPTSRLAPRRSTWRDGAGWSSTAPSGRSTWSWRTATSTRSPRKARPTPSVSPGRWSWP